MTTATFDDKKRVRIPDAKPGQVVCVEPGPDGTWKLIPLVPMIKRKWTYKEVLKAIDKSPRPFTKTWDELKKETR